MFSTVRNFFTSTARSSPVRARHLFDSRLSRPAPPPLPPKEQREFEELIRAAIAPAAAPDVAAETVALQARIAMGDELHPDARRPPPPEFEGDTNPVTGEVGGPKREPVLHGDWSFAGRTSDF